MHNLLIMNHDLDDSQDELIKLPWQNIGINIVHQAFSIDKALEIIKTNPIDILIVNHFPESLPGGNELIKLIHRFANYISCILLDDAGIQMVSCNNAFILGKPFSSRDLLALVEKTIQNIEKKWTDIIYQKRELITFEDHLPILQKYFLRGRIKDKLLTNKQFLRSANILEFSDAIDRPMCLLLIRIDDQLGQFNHHHTSLFELAIYNILKEMFESDFNIYYCIDDFDYMVVMISQKAKTPEEETFQYEPVERGLLQLQHYAKRYLSISLSVLISKTGIFPDELSTIYHQSANAFRQKISEDQEVILKDSEHTSLESVQHLSSIYSPPLLNHLLEAGQWKSAFNKLETIFTELNNCWRDSHEHLLETYFHIAGAFSYYVHRNNQLMKEALGENYDKMLNLDYFHTISQLQKWAYDTLEIFKSSQHKEIQNSQSLLVKKVHDFVYEHIEKASLQTISNHLKLNQSYLSKLYKDQTGENLSDYLFRIRMQRAALLLKQTDKKVYEIAQELGYFKISYFIKLFRDYHGTTPQKFREN